VSCLHLGDLDRAASILEETLRIHEELGTLATRADVFINLTDVALRQGNRERAWAYFEQGIELYRLADDPKGLHNAYYSLGCEQVESGKPQEALRSFQECLRYADRANNRLGIADGIERISSLAIGTDHAEEAARLAGAAKAIRDSVGAKSIPDHQGFLTNLHTQLGRALGDATYERAIAAGRDITPRQATTRAFELADRLVDLAPRGKPKPVAAPPVATPGPANPFKLTKREIEVLRLLSEGRTDREIAATLFISPRTAGTHVANIFGKLEVDSRAAAVSAAFRNNLI
jgi:non-specific serine/threonine protein kinase